MPDRTLLFELAREKRAHATDVVALVPVTLTVCPTCTATLDTVTVHEDALLRHGGHGATRSSTRLACTVCTWALTTEVSETRPPRSTVVA